MPLDPQIVQVMEAVAALGLPPNNEVSPEEARANGKLRPRAPGPEVGQVEDRTIPGPDGGIPVRIYTPPGSGNDSGPFPGLVWFHGGGWVVGDLDSADSTARHLCVGADCVVVSVDYRLAPDTKFPGPAEDCYVATQWLAANAASLNVDPARIATGGDSAGGNLSAAVSLMSRDRGGCPLVFQLWCTRLPSGILRPFPTLKMRRLPVEPGRNDLVLGTLPGRCCRRRQSLRRAGAGHRLERIASGPGHHRRV